MNSDFKNSTQSPSPSTEVNNDIFHEIFIKNSKEISDSSFKILDQSKKKRRSKRR